MFTSFRRDCEEVSGYGFKDQKEARKRWGGINENLNTKLIVLKRETIGKMTRENKREKL